MGKRAGDRQLVPARRQGGKAKQPGLMGHAGVGIHKPGGLACREKGEGKAGQDPLRENSSKAFVEK